MSWQTQMEKLVRETGGKIVPAWFFFYAQQGLKKATIVAWKLCGVKNQIVSTILDLIPPKAYWINSYFPLTLLTYIVNTFKESTGVEGDFWLV